MLISKDQTIAGIRAVQAREVVRFIGRRWPDGIEASRLEEIVDDAPSVLRDLAASGYLEVVDTTHSDGDRYQTTVAGNALRKARIGKPITMAKAAEVLAEFMLRMERMNDDPDELYRVDLVRVFGSYLDPSRTSFGDVDVAVLTSRRYERDEQSRRERVAGYAAVDAGRNLSIFEILTFADQDFKRRLTGRSKLLDLEIDGDLPPGTTWMCVYVHPDWDRAGDYEVGARRQTPSLGA
jgi:predicted nucleotidyltransferase